MIDADRLRAFMRNFYGYGTWTAKLWFVGMEEGGGGTLEEIDKRLRAWSGAELEDLREFHVAAGMSELFRERPRIQSTWGKLSRLALCAEGRAADAESVRRYQRDELGRAGGTTALIELLPLPSPSTKHWIYEDADVPEISTREKYRDLMMGHRIEAIRARIDEHRPRVVVFYGLGYREHWTGIAGAGFRAASPDGFESAARRDTMLVLAPHPVARRVHPNDFCRIGDAIRGTLS